MMPLHNAKRLLKKALAQPGYAVRVGAKRCIASLYYWLGNGRSLMPESITLFLTHRCNLRCKMCGQWGEGGVTKKQSTQFIRQELSVDELKKIVDDVARFRPNMTLFGGEPLLHTGCIELIEYIKQKKMHCLVISNGFLLEELAEQLVASGLDELNVSLDADRDLHDEIRGMPGLFDKIMRGLQKISALKKEKKTKKPFINLQCTITKYNIVHLEQMLDVARKAGADSLTYHNLIFTDKAIIEEQKKIDASLNCSSSDWEGFAFSPDIEPDALYAIMQKITSYKLAFRVDFYPRFSHKELREYYLNPVYKPCGAGRCLSPWIVGYIFPDAEVRPCLNCGYSFGNARDNKFSEVWNSEKAVRYRRFLKEKGAFPVCARCTELYRY